MASVFISFVHEDEAIAKAVKWAIEEQLEPAGEVFLSSDQVQPGDPWIEKLRAALESCKVLVSLLSARAIRRPWINFEAGAAWIRKVPVIPVCMGNMSQASLPQPYSGLQAVVLPRQQDDLLKAVAEHLGTYWSAPIAWGDSDLVANLTGEPAKKKYYYDFLVSLLREYKE